MDELKGVSNVRQIVRNSMVCPDGTVLISRHRHDYRTHTDANGDKYMVDGGNSYLRRSINDIPAIDTTLYSDDDHEVLRKAVTWGRRMEGGELEYMSINNMTMAHMLAIIADGYKSSTVDVMINEIAYRALTETESVSKRMEIQRQGGYRE